MSDRILTNEPEKKPEVSIIMPCLNEVETLGICIKKAALFLKTNNIIGEVVIGDNGSTDGSIEVARGLGARVVSIDKRGYGAALNGAINSANSEYIIMGDSDDSYDFSNLMGFVAELRGGCDLVMGNRFAGGIGEGAMPWKNRYIGNPILTGIGRLLFKANCSDFHCGLRGFNKQSYQQMKLNTTGMEFASEMVIKATLLNMKVVEVPTILSPDGRTRPPHLRPWRDGWRHLRFMLLYSPRWLFLMPGLFVGTISALISFRLYFGQLIVGKINFDIHTLVFSLIGVLTGLQLIIFAVMTKVYSIYNGLLPSDPKFLKLFEIFNLERGLISGLLLCIIGISWAALCLYFWRETGFGPLDVSVTLKPVIVAGFCFLAGLQIVLSSFFLSILGLRLNK